MGGRAERNCELSAFGSAWLADFSGGLPTRVLLLHPNICPHLPDRILTAEPLSELQTVALHLVNKTGQALTYKVKTTSPKMYTVRPNASVVGAGESIEVAISRQAKATSEPSKDKFLILTAKVDPAELGDKPDMAELWHKLESGDKKGIDETRIKVKYDFSSAKSATSESSSTAKTSSSPQHFAGITGADYDHQSASKSVAGDASADDSLVADQTALSVHDNGEGSTDLSGVKGVPEKSDIVSLGDAKTGPILSRDDSSYNQTGPSGSTGVDKSKVKDNKESESKSQHSGSKAPEESEELEAGVSASALGAVAAAAAYEEGGLGLSDKPDSGNKPEKQHVASQSQNVGPPKSVGNSHVGGKQDVGGKQNVGGKQDIGGKQNVGGKQEAGKLPAEHVGGKQAPTDSRQHTGGKQEKNLASGSSLNDNGVTKRSTGESYSSSGVATRQSEEVVAGVPLPVVAIIALIAFLLGWKLF